jgi:hypothetical protein
MVIVAFIVVGLRCAAVITSALRTLATVEAALVEKKSAAAANNQGGRELQAIVIRPTVRIRSQKRATWVDACRSRL